MVRFHFGRDHHAWSADTEAGRAKLVADGDEEVLVVEQDGDKEEERRRR